MRLIVLFMKYTLTEIGLLYPGRVLIPEGLTLRSNQPSRSKSYGTLFSRVLQSDIINKTISRSPETFILVNR